MNGKHTNLYKRLTLKTVKRKYNLEIKKIDAKRFCAKFITQFLKIKTH